MWKYNGFINNHYVCIYAKVGQMKTGKLLAEQLRKDSSTVSKWCSNKIQPSLEMLMQIVEKLDVDVRNLIVATK